RRELDSFEPEPPRDDLRSGPLEDPQLRVAVGLEGTVAVEMVGLEVQQHGDLASQLVHVLELEAGELADDPGARLDLAVELGQCAAHVPGDRRARHRAQELASRRLSVRAGDADQLRLQEAKAELDLAPDRDATSLGLDNERRLARDPGALDQYLHAVEQG